jgi:SAM-dependent methyltransferase
MEQVKSCPVCASTSGVLLYERLEDYVFFCAPGKWTLYRCKECGSAYLNPRPTQATLHLAYRSYFTHSAEKDILAIDNGRFHRVFANGYRNWRYGTRIEPSSRLGALVKALQPMRRAKIDAEMRMLPRAWPGATLLDLGCGSGQFLEWARSAGWTVFGVDPDPKAVTVAHSRGLEVHLGRIDELDPAEHQFDMITLSHVIEHVHDPMGVIQACHRLLKAKGRIWIETPNIDSIGHAIFQSHWRGLEPPRHLVLFTRSSLQLALKKAGFVDLCDQPFRPLCTELFAASEAIAEGRDPQKDQRLSPDGRGHARQSDRQEARNPDLREFVTLLAKKPDSLNPKTANG